MPLVLKELIILFTSPIYVLLIALEWGLTAWYNRKAYTVGDTMTNVYLAMLNGSLDLLMRGFTLWFLGVCYTHHFTGMATHGVLYWVLLFLLQDFAYYVLHCVDHFCRFFWAVHVTHHSSLYFNFTTGFRSSVFQPLYRAFYFAPIAFLGFEPVDIIVMYAATQIYGIFVHTENIGKLGILEWFMVTPSHHRVHHASNSKYLDKNMGMCLILWDRMFGTFQAEDPAEPVRFGLTSALEKRDPFNIVFHEWRSIVRDVKNKGRNVKEKLGYMFAKPGWAPKANN